MTTPQTTPSPTPDPHRDNAIKEAVKQDGDDVAKPVEAVRDDLWKAEDEFGTITRPPVPDYAPVDGVNFDNSQAAPLDAPGNGAAAAGFSEPILFVHFGKVYQDGRDRFAAPNAQPIDDTQTLVPPPDNVRAVHFRAALQREAILLAGFLRSTKIAVQYRYETSNSNKGQNNNGASGMSALAGALSGASDLLGGGTGSKSLITASELRPFFTEMTRIAATIDGSPTIEYRKLFTAGADLHVLRKTYQKWIETSLQKLDHAPVDKGMLNAAVSSLNPINALGAIAGPMASFAKVVGPMVALVQKWATVTSDAYFHMTLEYSLAMNDQIVKAASMMSEDALQRRAHPAFSVWLKPPPGPDAPATKKNIIQEAIGAANDVGNFLKRPVTRCPGSPFLDVAFEEPVPSKTGAASSVGTGLEARSTELPQLASRLLASVLMKHKVDLEHLGLFGTYLKKVIDEGSRTVADFLHAVYGVTTTLSSAEAAAKTQAQGSGQPAPAPNLIDRDHMLAAGRTHLVNKLVYLVLDNFGVLSKVRGAHNDVNGQVIFDPESLMDRGLAALESALEPALKKIDPVLAFAMYELADDLNDAAGWTSGQFTMETYLAILPATYAKLVRHLVFFLVDTILALFTEKVLNPALKAAGLPGVDSPGSNDDSALGTAQKLAGGPLGLVGHGLGKAGDLVDKVSKAIRNVQAVGDAIGNDANRLHDLMNGKYGTGPDTQNAAAAKSIIDGINETKNAKGNDKNKQRAPDAKALAAMTEDFPFKSRVVMGAGQYVTDDDVKAVQAEALKRHIRRETFADLAQKQITKKA